MVQVVECLPNKYEALSSTPIPRKKLMTQFFPTLLDSHVGGGWGKALMMGAWREFSLES
jgi:hypothetical protein